MDKSSSPDDSFRAAEVDQSSGAGFVRTFALNPTVDVSLTVPLLEPIHKIRAVSATREAGGGGVNVARVLARMDCPVDCVVAVGGAQGAEVLDALVAAGVPSHGLAVDGDTRESIQIINSSTNDRYRIVVDGPALVGDPTAALASPDGRGTQPRVVVLSGSLPTSTSAETYSDVARAYPDAFVIVDTSGDALRLTAAGPVQLLKPSLSELESLVGHDVRDATTLSSAVGSVLESHQNLGALLVSLGAIGAVLAARGEPLVLLGSPQVHAVSAIGAGDAMVAGVAAKLVSDASLVDAARFGVACGAAAVTTPGTELCRPETAARLMDSVTVEELADHHTIRTSMS